VRPGKDKLVQSMPGYVRLVQFISGLFMLFHVRSD
jgi:hypothetical protein